VTIFDARTAHGTLHAGITATATELSAVHAIDFVFAIGVVFGLCALAAVVFGIKSPRTADAVEPAVELAVEV
jgi:hypothetical protein